MRVADYIALRLQFLGLTDVYMVTGGAAMHLNDAFSREFKDNVHFLHHEQSCSMAAEANTRLTNIPCLVNITAGPGAINTLNGVFGAFVDSIPMIVISGQAKRETLVQNYKIEGLRQLGDQEVNVVNLASNICKSTLLLDDPFLVHETLNNMFITAVSGRPGPVWLDIPIDVQSFVLPDYFKELIEEPLSFEVELSPDTSLSTEDLELLAYHLLTDDRPVLYVGSGIRAGQAYNEFLEFLESWPVACVTGWNSNDLLWDKHPCYCGRPGTVGNRTGNFAVQFSKSLLIVGCRLNIRQISYNWDNFAPNSWKCHLDIDQAELNKPTLNTDLKLHAAVKGFFPLLAHALKKVSKIYDLDINHVKAHWECWRKWLKTSLVTYSPVGDCLPSKADAINPYKLIFELTNILPEGSTCVCSDGTACVVGFQAAVFKKHQRMFHNSGCASMGYEIPAAIGAYHATGNLITCLAGDGSIMMNLQELAIIGGLNYPIKILLLNNNGYHSIRQTQEAYFPDNQTGCGPESGLPFPTFSHICKGFNINYTFLSEEKNMPSCLEYLFVDNKPHLLEVRIDQLQQFSPKLASKKLSTGKMISASLEDMSPLLKQPELQKLRGEAFSIIL